MFSNPVAATAGLSTTRMVSPMRRPLSGLTNSCAAPTVLLKFQHRRLGSGETGTDVVGLDQQRAVALGWYRPAGSMPASRRLS
ncbi:hypothetical protein [Mycobacterium tilburgii]|uniref:hypothetical protein n=1 Tax=Mycobacterium tilburgii TaxID=44467 RepID=UPI0011825278|nr:hypothetical protein [Mycobacterium tilburgii]